jgi:hypothetical protein
MMRKNLGALGVDIVLADNHIYVVWRISLKHFLPRLCYKTLSQQKSSPVARIWRSIVVSQFFDVYTDRQ